MSRLWGIYGLWRGFDKFIRSCKFDQSVNLLGAPITSSTEVRCEQYNRGLFQDGLRISGIYLFLIYFEIKIVIRLNERKKKWKILFQPHSKSTRTDVLVETQMGFAPSFLILDVARISMADK